MGVRICAGASMYKGSGNIHELTGIVCSLLSGLVKDGEHHLSGLYKFMVDCYSVKLAMIEIVW